MSAREISTHFYCVLLELLKGDASKSGLVNDCAFSFLFRKQAIDQELAEIEPLIAEARAAVSEIRNEALTEIRSLRAPPEVIRDILEGVLRLMGILDTSWTSMKSFLAKRGVKDEIR